MDIRALQLESRFSLAPNSLGYCGKDTAPERFKKCIINSDCDGVEKEVEKFIVLYPYLETIAVIAKLPIFSYNVIESYWIGNDLLKSAVLKHYDLLLKNFQKQGVPEFFVKELKQKRPKIFIPNHLFQVLHVGVGQASGAVPFNLDSINNCMIRWGKVAEIRNKKVVINLHSLETKKPGYSLVVIKETVPFHLNLVPGLKTGDIVAVHWNMVVKILTKIEEKKLEYWTGVVLKNI